MCYIFPGAKLATEYANLAMKSSKADDIWTEIISTYSLHCMQGRSLFEAWRSYFMKSEPEYEHQISITYV